jgi:hypothetical protein
VRKILVLWIYSYPVKECSGFLRNKVCPVETFAVFVADQLKLLTVNKFIFTLLVQMSKNELNTNVVLWYLLDIKGYLSTVIMT